MSTFFPEVKEIEIDLAPAKSKIVAAITHDGPMSNFGGNDTRPDTMIQLSYVVDDYGIYYRGPKQSAIPFLGHGDNTDGFLKSIAWDASMWNGDFLTPGTRINLLASIESILKDRGVRFLPEKVSDPIDQPYGSFVKQGIFYFIGEFQHAGNTVWLKRQIDKFNTITSRWSFVKKGVYQNGSFSIEKKITFTDVTKWEEKPMSFEEAVSQYNAEINTLAQKWAIEHGYTFQADVK